MSIDIYDSNNCELRLAKIQILPRKSRVTASLRYSFFTKIELGKMDRVWIGSVDILYFVNVGESKPKFFSPKYKYIFVNYMRVG